MTVKIKPAHCIGKECKFARLQTHWLWIGGWREIFCDYPGGNMGANWVCPLSMEEREAIKEGVEK